MVTFLREKLVWETCKLLQVNRTTAWGQKVIYSCEITGTDSFQIEIVPEQRNHEREFHVPVDAAILPCVLLFC